MWVFSRQSNPCKDLQIPTRLTCLILHKIASAGSCHLLDLARKDSWEKCEETAIILVSHLMRQRTYDQAATSVLMRSPRQIEKNIKANKLNNVSNAKVWVNAFSFSFQQKHAFLFWCFFKEMFVNFIWNDFKRNYK